MSEKKEELMPLAVRNFLKNIKKSDSCWVWTGTLKHGALKYGVLTMNRKHLRAHRFSWVLHNGPIPTGMCVLHRCDNPPCVNIKHLFLGTREQNNADRNRKKRTVIVRGEKSGRAILNRQIVKLIKRHIKKGVTFSHLGQLFGVRWQTIQAIAKGRTWKHV